MITGINEKRGNLKKRKKGNLSHLWNKPLTLPGCPKPSYGSCPHPVTTSMTHIPSFSLFVILLLYLTFNQFSNPHLFCSECDFPNFA